MFFTALSSNRPRPVSATAACASWPCWSRAATAALATMWSTSSWVSGVVAQRQHGPLHEAFDLGAVGGGAAVQSRVCPARQVEPGGMRTGRGSQRLFLGGPTRCRISPTTLEPPPDHRTGRRSPSARAEVMGARYRRPGLVGAIGIRPAGGPATRSILVVVARSSTKGW